MLKPILERRSIRRYTDEAVSDAEVEQILEAARLAPSGSNTQPWRFTVVRDAAKRAAIAQASHRQEWMNTAPVHVVCVADIRCRIPGYAGPPLDDENPLPELKKIIRDTSIAVEHLVLEATELGLGTCWLTIAVVCGEDLKKHLGLADDRELLGTGISAKALQEFHNFPVACSLGNIIG